MKKQLLATVWITGVCLLTGCGMGVQKSEEIGYSTTLVEEAVQAGVFSESLEELELDTGFLLYCFDAYDLKPENLTDGKILRSAGATCEEMAVLIWEDETCAERAEEALEDYIEAQVESNRDYRPRELPKLEEAMTEERGNTTLLAIVDNPAALRALLPHEEK